MIDLLLAAAAHGAPAGLGGPAEMWDAIIRDFSNMLKYVESQSPLGRNVTIEDVGKAASFLLSDLASGVTGEILHVDCGFSNTVPGMD